MRCAAVMWSRVWSVNVDPLMVVLAVELSLASIVVPALSARRVRREAPEVFRSQLLPLIRTEFEAIVAGAAQRNFALLGVEGRAAAKERRQGAAAVLMREAPALTTACKWLAPEVYKEIVDLGPETCLAALRKWEEAAHVNAAARVPTNRHGAPPDAAVISKG